MHKVPFLSEQDFIKKVKTTITNNVAKATIQHIDGSTSEIKIVIPIYTSSGEELELSHAFLSSYVEELTAYHIKITGYQIHTGYIEHDGSEHYNIHYEPFEVPLNKVNHLGKWVDPKEIKAAADIEYRKARDL